MALKLTKNGRRVGAACELQPAFDCIEWTLNAWWNSTEPWARPKEGKGHLIAANPGIWSFEDFLTSEEVSCLS